MKRATALLLLPLVTAAAPQEDFAAPYRTLQHANRTLDASLAASAYATDGALIFEHEQRSGETFRGHAEIRAAYVRTFGQVDPGTPIEIEFRFDPPGFASTRHSGAYRLRASIGGRPIIAYGRFAVTLVKQNGEWRFAEDRGTTATPADFEKLSYYLL